MILSHQSRREAQPDEQSEGEEMEFANLNPEYAKCSELWSYKFSIKDIDDFQISIPNPNQKYYENKKQWSESTRNLFARVTITPGPEHEGTLFVTFNRAYYPEYVFYNKTEYKLTLQHRPELKKDSARKERHKCPNEIYVLNPGDRLPIVLNPKHKDEDYLHVRFLDYEHRLNKFVY